MKTVLDADLRERFADPEEGTAKLAHARNELAAWRREAAEKADDVSLSHVGRWLQRTSEYLRLSGDLDAALAMKRETLEVWEALSKRRAQFLVRLQTALVMAEIDPGDAETAFAALLEEMRGDADLEPFYLGFWLEYEARRLFWCGEFDAAIAHLEQALAFRSEHRAARIVDWTRTALARVRAAAEKV